MLWAVPGRWLCRAGVSWCVWSIVSSQRGWWCSTRCSRWWKRWHGTVVARIIIMRNANRHSVVLSAGTWASSAMNLACSIIHLALFTIKMALSDVQYFLKCPDCCCCCCPHGLYLLNHALWEWCKHVMIHARPARKAGNMADLPHYPQQSQPSQGRKLCSFFFFFFFFLSFSSLFRKCWRDALIDEAVADVNSPASTLSSPNWHMWNYIFGWMGCWWRPWALSPSRVSGSH